MEKIFLPLMARITLKLYTMVGEIFENELREMPRIAYKLSTTAKENLENYLPQNCFDHLHDKKSRNLT